jgi:tetratricopeptide (TPR) repeat protein
MLTNMKSGKRLMLMVLLATVCGTLSAQTLEEGRKFLYYERYKSARSVFEKLLAANPNNDEAAYWLGQTMIAHDEGRDLAGARELYRKTLAANSNSALLTAGMGHLSLLDNNARDARSQFETAITLSKGQNASVLNAVGLANVEAKAGDIPYAIEKLKQAAAIKKMADPSVFINLGNAYRKEGDGGNAQTAYESALTLNPAYAAAPYRIGKIYQTQGINQEEIYMRYYNQAMEMDPAYGPVYENLYKYYYQTDVGKSAGYLEKYLANTDDDPKNCYYRASMIYAQAKFSEAITKANECIASSSEPYPNLYGLIAYSYMKLKDTASARTQFETYFAKQMPEKIGPADYQSYADILLKYPPVDEEKAELYHEKAVNADSTEAGKTTIYKSVATHYEGQKKHRKAAHWHHKVLRVKKDIRKTDLYNAGYNYFRSGDYAAANELFADYAKRFPDDAFGYYMLGKSNWAIDSTMDQGLANPYFEKAITVGLTDSAKYKSQLIGSYKYFVVFNASKKKDKDAALSFCDKILAIDPNDKETINNKAAISAMNMNAPAPRPKTANPPAKPAGKGSGKPRR